MSVEILRRHPDLPRPTGPVILAILDGVGWGPGDDGDAVAKANKPNLDRLWQSQPTRTLQAHGLAVGLPSDADMGNSEVGHNALGAGRVFRQGAALVNDAIASGRLFQGEAWRWLVEPLVGPNALPHAALHLCGLLSDGNVHSHIDQVFALIRGADRAGVQHLRMHPLADGRDVEDPSFDRFVAQLQAELDAHNARGRDYCVASGGGRMGVTMDRYEADWSIVERGWHAHVLGEAPGFPDVGTAIAALRKQPGGESDQKLGPFVILGADGQPVGAVRDGDSFAFWNFRGDRAIELTRAFEDGPDFKAFDRKRVPAARYAGMMQYDGDLHLPRKFLVEPPVIERTSGEFLAALGLRTFAVSETQKYGHVTYFWNGNRSGVLAPGLEEYAEVPSDRISFDQRPEMRAQEITDLVERALSHQPRPDFVRLNFPNGDMVGHTGDFAATVRAVECVDAQVGRLIALTEQLGGVLIVTADHGNADDMWMRDGKGRPVIVNGAPQPKTSHTLSPVPVTILDTRNGTAWKLREDLPRAGLANVAATLFNLMGYEAPSDYEPSFVTPA
jgi:2,3-bisphosphoglycerate-independent phosphoglycerate mutase